MNRQLNRQPNTHSLYVLLEDRPGALHRVVTLFRRRSYNIASLNVERAEMSGVSRMNVALEAPSAEQVTRELERIIDVLAVRDVTHSAAPKATSLISDRVQADGVCDEMEEGDIA